MTMQEADSLARYIRRCSDRFHAEALPMGASEALVLLTDTEHRSGVRPLPPIREISVWLAQTVGECLDDACRELLEAYLLDREEDADEIEQVRRDIRPASPWLPG
jgi:hypothetical protein